jgi:putative ABC transport system ATP-binding protein
MAPQDAPLLAFRNVSKIYHQGAHRVAALDDVSFEVASGAFVAVMGPSGSGKSTCMNVLGCLDTPTSGSYRFQGQEVGHLNRFQRSRLRKYCIGFVFQGFHLLGRSTALENVTLPLLYHSVSRRERLRRGREALSRVGLLDWESHRPSELSGGQQQRVAIARALVTAPSVLLADEPTGNLDSQRAREIMELLVELNRQLDLTIVMVTHEDEMAGFARSRLIFRDGRVDASRATAVAT